MFSCLAVPIMEYCSEVWGPDLLFSCDTLDKLWANELQKIQNIFLRQLGKLRKSVPTTVVHKEMCMNPVAKGWLRASIDLWRRLCKVPSDSLLGMAVRESLASYAGEGVGSAPKSWAGRFMHTVRSLSQGRDADGTIAEFLATNGLAEPDNDKLAAIPSLKVWGAWDTMLQEPWDKVAAYANPRQSVSSNLIKLSTYHSWFMTGDIPQEELEAGYPQGMPRYIRHTSGIPFTYVKQLMRFRTGAHHLAIETGRWARPKLPRQHRVCSKCSCTVVEDEVHFLFECPAYDRIREKYDTVLFAQFGGCQEASSTMKHNSDNVRLFMDQEPSFQVAKFVYECMEFRRSEECEDYNPYFDLSLFGDEWQGRIFDTFSCGPRGDIAETFTSDGPGSSISAHGA